MLAEELHRPGARFLVGEDDAGIYGFAIGLVVMDELSVLQVGVDPDRRGQGLGSVLMRALHASAPHQGVSWLEVRASNAPAVRMYEALGYSVVSVRRRYYADGEDAVIMRLPLGG